MVSDKSRILFVFSTRRGDNNTAFGGFAKRLVKRGGLENIEIDYVALEDLMFEIKRGQVKINDLHSGKRIDNYDWVYFKSWEGMPDRAAALAEYLFNKGIPFSDRAVIEKGNGNKLVSHMKFWAHDIPIASTVYCAPKHWLEVLPTITLKYPVVIKAVDGQKGRMNFLAKNYDEAKRVFAENPEVEFIVQQYIPNTHDLRIQVYGGHAALVMQRMAQEGSHLNNTSAGGGAKLIPLSRIDKTVLRLAERAAAAVGLQVSGVDVMPNSKTGKYYILEANQGSQIVTGKFTHENIAAFNKFVKNQAKLRFINKAGNRKLSIIGRHEAVSLLDLGIDSINAKIDTGAYSSSIHAEKIKVVKKGAQQILTFQIPANLFCDNKPKTFEVEDFGIVPVKRASASKQERYTINTRLYLGGRKFITTFTLSDRGSMRYPVLIGRRVIRGRFLVNTELSKPVPDKGKI